MARTRGKKPQDHRRKTTTAARSAKSVTSARDWRKVVHVELELPSGHVCLVRRPGLPEILSSGIFPDDVLSIVQASMNSAKAEVEGRPAPKTEEDLLKDVTEDPKKIAAIWDAFDRATVYAVVEPKVAYHLDVDGKVIKLKKRDPDILYTDQIDPEDKIHIFNFICGGSSDVNRFREEQLALMANFPDS